jgi:uncharacterized protein (TIGR00255 family)
MISSMTGFGRAEALSDNLRVRVEIRSVNHRFLETAARLPKAIGALEPKVLECVQKRISRGKVNLMITIDGEMDPNVSLKVDEALARRYTEIADELRNQHGLTGEVSVETFLTLPNIICRESDEITDEAGWKLVQPPLTEALDAYVAMREKEGKALADDLLERVSGISSAVERVNGLVPEVVEKIKTRLQNRLADISKDLDYNQYRLESEITIFADRSDVTEECVRLRSHCEQFRQTLSSSKPAGRKLKFLLEEMHREVNTIGSKGQDTSISKEVIFMKEEVEKIREQVLNIE